MHRLVNRAIDEFMRATYGDALWHGVSERQHGTPMIGERAGPHRYEALCSAAEQMDKPESELFEDMGSWLARLEPVRRLLRFSGRNFPEFVSRLDELQGRAHLVVADLGIPPLRLFVHGPGDLHLSLPVGEEFWTCFLAGIIRTMADDYGALSLISVDGTDIVVRITDNDFFEGRDFSLSSRMATGTA